MLPMIAAEGYDHRKQLRQLWEDGPMAWRSDARSDAGSDQATSDQVRAPAQYVAMGQKRSF